ncbi:hypothetical protein SCP_1301320 [Sparassis crispa]|uniref:Uncharacterized protein n=1 Tax=Sparassis crispa TaxID=139825 RepID=A0A401H1K3_9APHY|nr:hypothetical protein SCP_1301320 [Sparassis crispa]GBE88317.1 hypothetical protein SCP_1301320 [Sparassis crispa]
MVSVAGPSATGGVPSVDDVSPISDFSMHLDMDVVPSMSSDLTAIEPTAPIPTFYTPDG